MHKVPTAALAAGAMLTLGLALPATAHHSRANFDLDTFVDREGVVKELSWRNPHAYVVIESKDETGKPVELTYEMNATPIMRRYGWTEHSLEVGEHVKARGNPDRNPAKHFYYAAVFTKDDGTELWSWDGGQRIRPPAPTHGSTDFSGVWRNAPRGDVLGRNAPDSQLRNDLPVTPAGQALLAKFDPDDDPTLSCDPYTLPGIVAAPYPFEMIHEGADTIRIAYELEHEERVIHMGLTEHPADVAPSHMGHSIGRMEGETLVVDTAKFAPVRWGLGQALDSSDRKHVVETYTLVDGGKGLRVDMTIEDPVYLTEPVKRSYAFVLHEGYTLGDYRCDPVTARRHLTAG